MPVAIVAEPGNLNKVTKAQPPWPPEWPAPPWPPEFPDPPWRPSLSLPCSCPAPASRAPAPSGSRYLASGDCHDRCLTCLGIKHVGVSFVDESSSHCGKITISELQAKIRYLKRGGAPLLLPRSSSRHGGSQMEQLLVAELGCSVIIPCSHSDDFINTVSWYKHSLGKKPLLIAYSEHGSDSVTYQNGFKKENQYFIRSGTGSFNLTIIHLEEYDSATYYCAVSFLNIITFGEGTILLRKDSDGTRRTTVLQQPVSDRLHPGDSVTLQCSVISQICAGEYSVYWFRHSSGHSDPGIIYTHDNRSDQSMERSESSSSTQSCVYFEPE
ncbi:uncharacterized protein LOC107660733 [Sinocyclocheilus anshuiensis]|uniref:uncharacterized protein LOC107660733 n=1 Tax=Sinocyclocheilus anshuiensis TaxID=1608454 RepID=UPI0007B9079A|nr:PREDICTED: uncharacterized protein LOC107660733 [Sinocyclocheilus anshuiensis]